MISLRTIEFRIAQEMKRNPYQNYTQLAAQLEVSPATAALHLQGMLKVFGIPRQELTAGVRRLLVQRITEAERDGVLLLLTKDEEREIRNASID